LQHFDASWWTLEKDTLMKICYRYWLYPNLSVCYGIGTHINDLLAQQNIFLFVKLLNIITITKNGLRRSSFHVNFQ
jgi:hypothetical protein